MKRETDYTAGESWEVIAEERTLKRMILNNNYIPLNRSTPGCCARSWSGFRIKRRSAAVGKDSRRNAW